MTVNEILSSPFLREIVLRATVVGVLVSVCASLLGVCLVMKRYSMIGDGLSHVGYFALALGAVAGVGGSFSTEAAMPVVILAAILILKLDGGGKISGDAACAIVSTGAVAVGTLIFSATGTASADICGSLFGSASVITVTNKDVVFSLVLSLAVITWFVLFYRQIFAVSFDESFAAASGVRGGAVRTALAVLTAVTIVVGMKMMGAIMISALIVFPALSAKLVCKSFKGVVIFSAAVSVICFAAGFICACLFSLQTGAAVVTADLAAFIIIAAASKLRSTVKSRSVRG